MRALIFVYIVEEVVHAHVQNAPLEWFSSTAAQALERGLLVAYPMIVTSGQNRILFALV